MGYYITGKWFGRNIRLVIRTKEKPKDKFQLFRNSNWLQNFKF